METSLGKVTVVVPVYNGEKHVVSALRGVMQQTYRDTEIIVIDDGSSDDTPARVAEVTREFPSAAIRYVRHEVNRGLAAARNTGLSLATGTRIAFLDHDDRWEPAHLTEVVGAMQRVGADLGCAGAVIFDDATGETMRRSEPTEWEKSEATRALFLRNFATVSGTVVSRRAVERVGVFRAAPKGCEDYDYWLRTARHGFKICFTGRISVGYRASQNQMSAARDYMVEGECVAIKLNLKGYPSPLVERLKRASSAFQTLGFIYYTNRPHLASRAFFRSWRFWPANFTPLWLSIKLVWRHGLR